VQLFAFTRENLAISLSNNYTPPEVIQTKNHFQFFLNYLGDKGLNAKTVLIEDAYISKDFIQDYASYYAFCFQNYPKFCKRVHFFDSRFSESDFKKQITQPESDNIEFWSHYLGFIVVKPIPVTVIGYTVLKTYSQNGCFNSRNFWGTREYKIHLYGTELKLNSLAFQEQDSVLAACATTAIWSMLNKASIDFHTILKSPSQITKDADIVSPDGSRLFPNKGLNLFQICQAILNSGLVSEVKQPDCLAYDNEGNTKGRVISNLYLKKIINAYSAIGIPIILVISVPNGGTHGLHAITISGFKQRAPKSVPPSVDISWLAANIEKIYAHDDQWGPFARIDFIRDYELETPWTVFDPDKNSTLVTNVVVSIYPKIRISYEDIELIVLGLDRLLTFFFADNNIADLVWDIKIDYSEKFKSDIKSSALCNEDKERRLMGSMPKYLWVASCYVADLKVFDFTFDATDVNNGMIGKDVVCYFEDVKPILKEFLEKNKSILNTLFGHKESVNYYDFLIKNLDN
jgi:hypothetical protein